MNQDLVLSLALPVTLFLMMLSMGANLEPRDFRLLLARPSAVLTGIAAQMLILPLLAFVLLAPLGLPPEIFVGFMILALAPGGTTSNVFSYFAGGNVALSITLTALVSLLVPFTLPLVAGWILAAEFNGDQAIELPFLTTLGKLVVVTLIPVAGGMLLRRYRPGFCRRHEFWMTRVPFVMLLGVIAGIVHQNWARMPEFLELTGLPSLLLAAAALLAGYGFARGLGREPRDARTIAIEASIQNGGTALLVTGTILQNPAMTIAPVMYGILMLLPVLAYLGWLRLGPTRAATA